MTTADVTQTLLLGLGSGLGLIVAVGAQNAYVLQRAIRGDVPMAPVVAVCVLSEALLLTLGILGVGALVGAAPWVLTALTWFGVVFLVAYGFVATSKAVRGTGEALTGDGAPAAPSLAGALAAMAAFTWLNPHAYLDTVVFLGSLANRQGPELRWVFGLGAFAAAVLWFSLNGFGGRALRGVFATPAAWRVLDGLIAVMMFVIAAGLVWG